MINIIAAIAQNNAIGFDGKLLYHLPDDLKRFRELTSGHTIIMGRKTFESLPKGALPNRRNIVLSRKEKNFPGAETYTSLAEALESSSSDDNIFIIGGASVYAEALPTCHRLCLTEIHDTPSQADAFFPTFSKDEWQVVFRVKHDADQKHAHSFDFTDYIRK